MSRIDEIFALFERLGSRSYGEDLSLGEHMLQAAAWAKRQGAPAPLIAAALLHDVGHFLHPDGESPGGAARDIEHPALGAAWLSQAFGEDVTAPIALHVEAKRYLCSVEPDYFAGLSGASRVSLAAQGGPMTGPEARAFASRPHAGDAVRLRRWDDLGKDPALELGEIGAYRDLLQSTLAA
jgi:gamma-butyrobetaine dioxygenase